MIKKWTTAAVLTTGALTTAALATAALTTAALTTGALGAAAATASSATAPAHHRAGTAAPVAAWHVAAKVRAKGFPIFSAVTATSSTSAWAFEFNHRRAAAYKLTGSSWARRSFPGKTDEQVVAASSSSSGNVWAFTSRHRALLFNGHSWAASKTFSKAIGSGLALSHADAWVFGEPFAPGAGLGSWHYNGKRWAKSATGGGLFGASALSKIDIWAFGYTKVAHWTGVAWTDTSVASLLPANTELCSSHLTGIWAQSTISVWAIGTGGCQDQGGPFVLLHYNGASWSQVALMPSLGAPVAIVPDGMGGAWIPVLTGFPGDGSMEHLTSGTLSPVTLPIGPLHLALLGAAIGKRTTAALAVGYSRKSFSSAAITAVILRYGS